MSVRIGVDTGGTFTDVVLYDADAGRTHTAKTPSTPPDFDRGVLAGIDAVLERTGVDPADVEFLSHGTTVGTNAVLEGDLPSLGLLTNEGLRDVLEIGDQTRPALYDLQVDKPPQLIPRRHRYGVPGRIDYAGEEVDPLDEAAVREAVRALDAAGVESIVVSMLFSYLEDAHERRVGELIEAEAPGLEYALSSAVYPESREYDRTVTTVLNEAVKRRTGDYFDRLREGVADRGIDAPLYVMHSGGGVFGVDAATRYALRTVLSGPAAGAVGARDAAGGAGFEYAIGLDMGGTSADVSLVEGGELVRATEGEINDLPIKTPLIDVNTVGAGGGSVAWLDAGGGLRVGPDSAGAEPGPICYDRGGERPTVTDAQVLLGRIDPSAFGGEDVDGAVERARAAFGRKLADPLGEPVEAAALSVLQVANARMARELRRVTVERGRDPGEFALVAFGGAGPLHAPAVADHVALDTVVVPRSPGVLSARGLLLADVRMDESVAYRGGGLDPDTMEREFESLERTVERRLDEGGFGAEAAELRRTVDMRYRGQSYELQVPVEADRLDAAALESVRERFDGQHARLYGHAMPEEPVEVVALRVAGTVATPGLEAASDGSADRATGERAVYFEDGGFRSTPVLDRDGLAPGDEFTGPAVIEDGGSTALVPPGTAGRVVESGAVVLER
ncbi:MAG: hydantoinase/oxoprolinase family protein [Halobacteriales archaeon]|nr:hydantoinase/oxoprolinase family protein [Halobacteriales archaeon]